MYQYCSNFWDNGDLMQHINNLLTLSGLKPREGDKTSRTLINKYLQEENSMRLKAEDSLISQV
jgi:hypothetical protein